MRFSLSRPPPCCLRTTTHSRKAGFPRGHVFNSCGQPPPPADGGGAPPPPSLGTAQTAPHPSSSSSPRIGETVTRNTATTAARVARGLVADVFCKAPDGAGSGQQHSGGDGGAHGRGAPGVLPRGAAAEGRVAMRKLPKRLRRAVPLFEEMIGRAHRCRFGRLLEAHCPLPVSVRRAKALGRTAGQAGRDPHETGRSGMCGLSRGGRRGP